jgi:hypothetical protein
MQTSILFTLAAGLFASAVAAQDTLGAFSDPVNFSLHYTKGNKTVTRLRQPTIGVDVQLRNRLGSDRSVLQRLKYLWRALARMN